MPYPKLPDLKKFVGQIVLYSQLKHEYGSKSVQPVLNQVAKDLKAAVAALKALPIDTKLASAEPNDLKTIRTLRPSGPRRMWKQFDGDVYRERLEGALLARLAGNALGAPVEGWTIERMQRLSKENDSPFPPKDYWIRVPDRLYPIQGHSKKEAFERDKMNGVPDDDDTAYTYLGLLIAEAYGLDFATADVAKAWLQYLPHAWTAEGVVMENLKKGIPAEKAAEKENPFCEWIGADIRSDPWGYMAPGDPEFAADMAYRDAYLSHRRQGIYGEMYFSAAIAAAFATDDPVEALKIGLTEIPKNCSLAKAVRWALKVAPEIKNYRQARDAMDEKFEGMSGGHTTNNACLTIWGITIGGKNVTKVLGETVAMGVDNDCTTATAGSIVGAVVGKKGIPEHWYKNFNNTAHSYLIGKPKFAISGLVTRFARQAAKAWSHSPPPRSSR